MGDLRNYLVNDLTRQIFAALLVLGLVYGFLLLARRILFHYLANLVAHTQRFSKREVYLDDMIRELGRRTYNLTLLLLAVILSLLVFTKPKPWDDGLKIAFWTVVILQVGAWGLGLIDWWTSEQAQGERGGKAEVKTTMNAVRLVLRVAVWAAVILLILVNVTGMGASSLIAALGVTGVAVALAVQNILGDLFSSVSIAVDKPFVIGDSIAIGTYEGQVESIGLKSTRVNSIDGEQLVFSNSYLLNNPLRNLQRRQRRRMICTFNIDYDTPPEKVAAIPAIVGKIVQAQEKATFDRAVFKNFGAYALQFECIYYIETVDLSDYLRILQEVNQSIYAQFAEQGIAFGVPRLDGRDVVQ
jgi:small-conductance mechanosensitive channel